ncbi:MAG: CDP-alcohol phosphatidyltransferase family protein [Actinomycetota bacterium]
MSIFENWRTWSNLVTIGRLALIPLYIWLAVWTRHRAEAAWLLAALGATDWVDGYLARKFNQVSELGKILDPVADRILVMSCVVTIAYVGAVPWWFALATLSREVLVSGLTIALALLGAARIDVLYWGKVSTFSLMAAYPLFLLTWPQGGLPMAVWQSGIRIATWAIGSFGLTLAWGVLSAYVGPARRALTAGRAGRKNG